MSRRRRADAERSIAAILAAAARVLGERPDASVEDIAEAAGVSRQTVYAHYPSREALIGAVVDRITEETVAAIDAVDLESGSAAAALERLIEASWRMFERYPLLLNKASSATSEAEDRTRHLPVLDRLERLIERGQAAGEFDRELPRPWLLTATMALGHAAGEEVGAGRMSAEEADATLRTSLLRVYGVEQRGRT